MMSDRLVIAGSELPNFLAAIDPSLVWMAALLVGVTYWVISARKSAALSPRSMYWLGVWALLGGIWGSHLLNLAVNGANGDSLEWLRVWEGAKSYFGGLFGGVLAVAIYLRARKLPVLTYADATVPGLALGYGIGRLGCFLNGDDFGTLSTLPWAVQYPPGTEAHASQLAQGLIGWESGLSLAVHPVQLYSSLLGFSLFIFFSRWRFRNRGSCFSLFVVTYGIARFALEWVRGDATAALGPLSVPQVCSLILVFFGLCIWWNLQRSPNTRRIGLVDSSFPGENVGVQSTRA